MNNGNKSTTKKLMNCLARQGYSDEQISDLVKTCLLLSLVKETTFESAASRLMQLMEQAERGDYEND